MLNHFSLTGLSPSPAGFPKTILLSSSDQLCSPNPMVHAPWFGLFRVRSPLLTESIVSFSSSGYLDVSVHRVPLHTLWIGVWIHEVFSCGFPHSEICGSMDICSLPQLIAAYHVFHRLLVPRHPPCALLRLTASQSRSDCSSSAKMGFLRSMTVRFILTVYHSPSHLCADNSWYIALYAVICFFEIEFILIN